MCAAFAFLTVISCGQDRTADPRPGSDPEPEPNEEPIVGGACRYEPVTFTVIIDSVRMNGDVILHPVDSVPWIARSCPLREESNGRWRATGSIVQRPVPGDTAVVEGEVIAIGTCVPCSIVVRPMRER